MACGCYNCVPAARLIARGDAGSPTAVMESLPFSTPGHLTFQIHSGGYLNPEMMFCLERQRQKWQWLEEVPKKICWGSALETTEYQTQYLQILLNYCKIEFPLLHFYHFS